MINFYSLSKNIWKEGKYLDFWNVNHILAGCLLAFVSIFLNISFIISLIISFAIMLFWEIYEYHRVIKETLPNQILDIITGFIGFFIVYYIYSLISYTISIFLFIISLIIWICLTLWGLTFIPHSSK